MVSIYGGIKMKKISRFLFIFTVLLFISIIDVEAAGSGEADAMKKAGTSFIKRLIAVAVLFLLPVIVDFILNMVNLYGVDPNNVDCLQTPTNP